jgi:hypothetical protein
MKEVFKYLVPIRNGAYTNKDWKLTVVFYDTEKELCASYFKKDKGFIRIGGIYANFKGPSVQLDKHDKIIGTISFQKEEFSIEYIIHESFHAMLNLYKIIGKGDLDKYEERAVSGCATLAAFLIEQFKDRINK